MGYKFVFEESFMSYLSDVTVLIPVKDRGRDYWKSLDEALSIGIPREHVIVINGYSADKTVDVTKSREVVIVVQGVQL